MYKFYQVVRSSKAILMNYRVWVALLTEAACREIYTDLVTVYNDEENTALINLTNTRLPANSKVWIGLQRSQCSSKWSNGDEVTFNNMTARCGTMPSCAVMKTNGSWDNITCTETRNFMCYKQSKYC
uniref:C-type lectin domain-containing protein n=1 Tax=Astyanax mexicanus TaxID=7994 RepID=W5L2V0_ASTMX